MMNEFKDIVKNIIDEVTTCEHDNIIKASNIIFNSVKDEGILHVFATGHSHMAAEEMFYRAGGLACVDPILVPMLMQHEGSIRSTKAERLKGLAKVIFDSLDLKDNEPFIIVSNSGINAVPIEMALLCKENNYPVIAITSMSAKNTKSRYNDMHLYEVADVVIDNHVPLGDATINIDGFNTGAISSIITTYIMQSIVINVVKLFRDNNMIPPIYLSANTPLGDEHNKTIYEKYKGRIKSLY